MPTLEIAGEEVVSQTMDHLGLVAAVCKDLGIVERINQRIGSHDRRRVVQPGEAVVAMILNGLGFTNRRLYLTPQFFSNKAMEYLLDKKISATQLDDHTLGKALDEIADYGATRLFGEIAFDIGAEQGLLGKKAHLDTTSFVLHGQYETEEVETIEVTHGYSKAHRHDLKQVMLSLTMTGEANIPLWMEPQNGNSSDKKSFHETIQRVRSFQDGLKQNVEFLWIADSALYTADKLLAYQDLRWLTRVPETIKASKNLIEQKDSSFSWEMLDKGYKITEQSSEHGGIKQRWLLVYSEQAYKREQKTFEKKLLKKEKEIEKAIWHLMNQRFNCAEDAEKALNFLKKGHKFFSFTSSINEIRKYNKTGRPGPKSIKEKVGYEVVCRIEKNLDAIEVYLRRKGRFILATNDLDQTNLSGADILKQYKEQQAVEGGFRFLKDPWFMVDSFYLKKRKRIEALMMVMTLCLLVYNFAQHKLRLALKEQEETLPNQLGKQVKNPTMRWVFQIMEGISIVKIWNASTRAYRICITNLTELRQKIIKLMGQTACEIYGIQKNVAGM